MSLSHPFERLESDHLEALPHDHPGHVEKCEPGAALLFVSVGHVEAVVGTGDSVADVEHVGDHAGGLASGGFRFGSSEGYNKNGLPPTS